MIAANEIRNCTKKENTTTNNKEQQKNCHSKNVCVKIARETRNYSYWAPLEMPLPLEKEKRTFGLTILETDKSKTNTFLVTPLSPRFLPSLSVDVFGQTLILFSAFVFLFVSTWIVRYCSFC